MEDVYQNTCLAVLDKIDDLDSPDDFPQWAFHIAWLRAQEFYRLRNRTPRLLENPDDLPDDESVRSDGSDTRVEALEKCLGQLREPHRQLLAARYCDQCRSWQEIARALNKSVEAVTTTCSRLRKKLHDCMNARLV